MFGNDALAIGFMRVAQQRGIRMPQDLSIVGFDNIPSGAMVWPGLTTVAQPIQQGAELHFSSSVATSIETGIRNALQRQ